MMLVNGVSLEVSVVSCTGLTITERNGTVVREG